MHFRNVPRVVAVATLFFASVLLGRVQGQNIPDALQPWEPWVTWDDEHLECPTVYHSADERICFWPARLTLAVTRQGGTWNIDVTVFSKSWVPIPGSSEAWPLNVKSDEDAIAVVQRDDQPAVQLAAGSYKLSGEFLWDQMPQRIAIPPQIGILSLSVASEPVPIPSWDTDGHVWLRRERVTPTEKDSLSVQVYRVIDDDIPTWLQTEIELTVSGKSREEELGWTLPAGFKLSTIESVVPVAVDEAGRMKAQVRAGKWTIRSRAFRLDRSDQVQFAENAKPITNSELLGFRAKPDFRLAEIVGLPSVDVTQTTFPAPWRDLPVYQWNTSSGFQVVEKIRGMGLQPPEGLKISRHFWLDEDGKSLTYQDQISGHMQQTWRLDVADGQQLGVVRVDGKGQLITANPSTGSHGVEIRTRNLQLEAIGRIEDSRQLTATGWQSDADELGVTMELPPGYRAFALFGADHVEGDWLTAWSLLDLFLLLIFSLSVYRLFGFPAGVIAFLAFGLAYHEFGSPRLTWLFLLLPVSLLKVVPEGTAKKLISVWKYIAVALLAVNLVPFAARQIQTAIYPQLEIPGVHFAPRGMFWTLGSVYRTSAGAADRMYESREAFQIATEGALPSSGLGNAPEVSQSRFATSNLKYDPKAKIQTGPAQPQWSWNVVYGSWDGPVAAEQTMRPVLIPIAVNRTLNVVRVLLLVLLGAVLTGVRRISMPSRNAMTVTATLLLLCCTSDFSSADEIPNQQMLDTLRARLVKAPDVYPNAAEIPTVQLSLEGSQVRLEAEVHAAIDVAVPLPGRLADLSPATVTVDNEPSDLVCRKDGYLWVLLPKGVHRVRVVSMLPGVSDWEWTFLLRPRRVTVNAPGWNVTGIRANGIPEQQVFFARQIATEGVAAYDRKDFNAVVLVDRYLEIGLLWQVRTSVTRLAADGKAVSLQLPLLPDENVLTPNVSLEDGRIDVRLGAGQQGFTWDSELPVGAEIRLASRDGDEWIERWHLLASPVWNSTRDGLAPAFEPQEANLIPVWHPWPGEQVTLAFNRPQPVSGENVTVQQVAHTMSLGSRQRAFTLRLDVECSIGSDFLLEVDPEAVVTSLKLDGEAIPVRRAGAALGLSLHPGKQVVEAAWKTNQRMKTVVDTGTVKLPVPAANATTTLEVPINRWVLWADGPLRGPAVRFWTILIAALIIALSLGSVSGSPLSRRAWVLLAIGLTQVHVAAGLIVVGWFFLLVYRGKRQPRDQSPWMFNAGQIVIVLMTFVVLGIFIVIVGAGLLGNPEMFIVGNGSTRTSLQWFQPRAGQELPVGRIVSVSVWIYRLLMLFWALWLAASLLRWLKWGWTNLSHGGFWARASRIELTKTFVAEPIDK